MHTSCTALETQTRASSIQLYRTAERIGNAVCLIPTLLSPSFPSVASEPQVNECESLAWISSVPCFEMALRNFNNDCGLGIRPVIPTQSRPAFLMRAKSGLISSQAHNTECPRSISPFPSDHRNCSPPPQLIWEDISASFIFIGCI